MVKGNNSKDKNHVASPSFDYFLEKNSYLKPE